MTSASTPTSTPSPAAPPAGAEPAAREVFVVRSPVFDESLRVLGYELLVGGEEHADADVSRWTAGLLVDAFAEVGLDALTHGRPAWLPVAPDALVEFGPPPVRPDRALLLLALTEPASAALVAAVHRATGRSFAIVLDALPSMCGDLLGLAAAVKVPVAGRSDGELRAEVAHAGGTEALLVATGVETHEELARCRELGFKAFQGSFLARPDVVPGRAAPTHRLQALTMMARLTSGELDFEEVEQLIVRDVGLSHKLLRYANSALFSLRQRVGSVREAMMLLGAKPVQRWAAALALSGVRDQPHELIVTALIRARMCELLTKAPGGRDRAFTVGLFSVVNALLGVPMREALADLPLADEVKEAILRGSGPDGQVLRAVVAWQLGDFAPAPPGVSRHDVAQAYRDAVRWADEASTAE